MCTVEGESVDRLLLHCSYDKELWDIVFVMFGVQWVMPRRVVDLFACWQGRFGRLPNAVIWKAIPHCVMWCLWRERNSRTFEGCEINVLDLKLQLFRTLFEWLSISGMFSFTNMLEFLDLCSFRS